MILSALLNLGGDYGIAQATDGFEALEHLRGHGGDVCLVDFDMPGMTGLEFVERARSEHPGLHCIMVTGTPVADLAKAAQLLGVNTILSKAALSPSVLGDAIRMTMGTCVE